MNMDISKCMKTFWHIHRKEMKFFMQKLILQSIYVWWVYFGEGEFILRRMLHFQYIALKILFNFIQTRRKKFLTGFLKMVHIETEISVYLDPGENHKRTYPSFFLNLVYCGLYILQHMAHHTVQRIPWAAPGGTTRDKPLKPRELPVYKIVDVVLYICFMFLLCASYTCGVAQGSLKLHQKHWVTLQHFSVRIRTSV